MKKSFIYIAILLTTTSVSAQNSITDVLNIVEQNNISLSAKRGFRDVQIMDEKMANNLEDPTVEFVAFGAKDKDFGKKYEFTLLQEFDFPTVYAKRSKLAKIRADQFGYEYAAERQALLLEASQLCMEIQMLYMQEYYLELNMRNAERLKDHIMKGFRKGDVLDGYREGTFNAMEANSVQLEYVAAKNAHQINRIELETANKRLTNLNGGQEITILERQFPDYLDELSDYDQLLDEYMNSSPELLAKLMEQKAAWQDVKVSRGKSLPSLGLGYKHDYDPGTRNHGLVVSASIPIFSNRNNVKRAKAMVAIAEAELNKARLDVETRLSQMYQKAEIILWTIYEYGEFIDDSSLDALEKAYNNGDISIMAYYNEVVPIYDACLELIAMKFEYLRTWAELEMINL